MTPIEFETSSKVFATHRYQSAVVYVRQSTPGQVEHNTESTDRQYALAERESGTNWGRLPGQHQAGHALVARFSFRSKGALRSQAGSAGSGPCCLLILADESLVEK